MDESSSIVLYDLHTADREVVAAAGFLAGYTGRTREAYTLDLRQLVAWCREHGIGLFDVRRAEIEPQLQVRIYGRLRGPRGIGLYEDVARGGGLNGRFDGPEFAGCAHACRRSRWL